MNADPSATISLIFTLLVIFQIKHMLADYPLQTQYMLGKFKSGWEFFFPLAAHCAVHAVFTLVILLVFAPNLWFLAFFDFAIHFLMDRLKAGPKYLGRFQDTHTSAYWSAFGFDQMVHHLTHYTIIWLIIHYR